MKKIRMLKLKVKMMLMIQFGQNDKVWLGNLNARGQYIVMNNFIDESYQKITKTYVAMLWVDTVGDRAGRQSSHHLCTYMDIS